MDELPQFVLTHTGVPDGATQSLFATLRTLGQLQNRQCHLHQGMQGLDRNSETAEQKRSELFAAAETLEGALQQFSASHRMNPERVISHFGGIQYPAVANPVAIFDADYNHKQGWVDAASESIGYLQRRARILPAAMKTDEALKHLEETADAFKRNKCRPAIVEISEAYGTPTSHKQKLQDGEIDVWQLNPNGVMRFLCDKMGVPDCFISQRPLGQYQNSARGGETARG